MSKTNHPANDFMKGKNYRLADWGGSQNSVIIEFEYIHGDGSTECAWFNVGGPFERFTNILKDENLTQEQKDLMVRGTLNGICFCVGWLGCFDIFVDAH